MSGKVWFPEFDEYIKERQWKDEHYPKNKGMIEYEKLKVQVIRDNFFDAYGREPTEEEIEEQKIEVMKIEYLVESWEEEFFEKVKKECEEEKQRQNTKKGPRNP